MIEIIITSAVISQNTCFYVRRAIDIVTLSKINSEFWRMMEVRKSRMDSSF